MIRKEIMGVRVLKYSIVLIVLFTTACSKENKNSSTPPVTESEALNELLNEATFQWVDLNETDIDTILVPPENIYEEKLFVSESLYVVSPTHMTVFNEEIIVNEFGKANVVIVNENGVPQRNLGREGRGPGEFERPEGLMTDGTHLYIYDDAQKRVSVFNKKYDLVETFDLKNVAPSSFGNTITMNNKFIAHQSFSTSGFYSTESGGILQIRLKSQPDSVHSSAIPRVVPVGMQPASYNSLLVSINNRNNLVAVYPALPYLIVFEDLEHSLSIGLKSTHFDTTESPSLRPTTPKGNNGVGVKNIIADVKILDNGDILMYSYGLLHHFVKQEGNYKVKKSYSLLREDTRKSLMIRDLAVNPENPSRFYVLGWRHIYKIGLPASE